MASSLDATLSDTDDNDTKLINAAIKHNKDEGNYILELWKELKKDPSTRMAYYVAISTAGLHDHTKLEFNCIEPRNLAMWKAWLNAAIATLNPIFSITTIDNTVSITIHSEDVGRVLRCLKPLAPKLHVDILDFTDTDPVVVKACADFFHLASVNKVIFCPENQSNLDFTIWLDFVWKVEPSCVFYYRFGLMDEDSAFLVPLADLVEAISIEKWDNSLDPLPLSIICEMLKRQCKYLDIDDDTTVITLCDAENLVKFFTHLEKKVALKVHSTNIDLIEIQIGEYKLENFLRLLIEHLDIVPTLHGKFM